LSSDPHNTAVPKSEKLDAAAFRRVCGAFATGVAVATVRGRDGKPHGLTVNSFTSVSLEPPLVLVCVGHKAASHGPFSSAEAFAINVLAEDQRALSARFASSHPNRFDGVDWYASETGLPLLKGALAVLECGMWRRIEAGDHTIYIGRVRRATATGGRPLLYFEGRYAALG